MRLAANVATLAALIALGLALGRWLREPNGGGLVFLLLLVVLVGLAVRQLYRDPEPARAAAQPREPDLEADPEPPLWDHRVDLNAASVDDLQRLPGVGSVAARRIVDDREANGPFSTVEELTRVPGFGPAKVRVLAPEARVTRGD